MDSILNEIKKLRKENDINIDQTNSNRHRIVVYNTNGTKTAYCFSAPIYNETTLKSVDFKFHNMGEKILATGSNALIDVSDKIQMKNRSGKCNVCFKNKLACKNEKILLCGKKDIINLTSNGIVYIGDMSDKNELSFEIETSSEYTDVLKNNVCFSLMKEKFRPYLTVSCIGCLNEQGHVIAPAEVIAEKTSDKKWRFSIIPCVKNCNYLKFEINLYEQKILQDTTVESLHPSKRNAFGSIAFVGNTEWFGKQWFYIRPELIANMDLINKRTNHILIRLPKLNDVNMPICAFEASRKFCSFGSRWEKKVPAGKYIGELIYDDNYATLNITDLVFGEEKNKISIIGGIILKPLTSDMSFIALATGDNYNTPPILEINYNI